MSEYQYYEFLALDRPLTMADRQALRTLSSRARITATQFINSYEWGDFKGDPLELMERWFDLHLYYANWGTRQLMIRLPKQVVDLAELGRCLDAVEEVTLHPAGDTLILDILFEDTALDDEMEEADDGHEGSGRLGTLTQLRADLIAGDLRLFHLLWLTAVETGALPDDAPEPLPPPGPLTASLQAFADFIRIDPDLLQAATEGPAPDRAEPSQEAVAAAIAGLPDAEKTVWLLRLFNADPHVGAALRRQLNHHLGSDASSASPAPRTAGILRARAEAIRHDRIRARTAADAARRKQQAKEAEAQRRAHLDALAQRGDGIWSEIEDEINRRTASGYIRAVGLLSDMQALAARDGRTDDFRDHLANLRTRHAHKGRFLERLTAAGL